jgi:hypothetical protein
LERLRKMRVLRGLLFVAMALGGLAYALGPMRHFFWKPADPSAVCLRLQRGESANDRWGTPIRFDPATQSARSAGPDHTFETADDLLIGCSE